MYGKPENLLELSKQLPTFYNPKETSKKKNFWSLKIKVESQQDGSLGIGTSNQAYNQSSFPGTRRMKGEN